MADTAEIQLALATIWQYLRSRIADDDIGSYPQEDIVIGAGVSKRKPNGPFEIARQDAQAAGDVWNALCQGNSDVLNHPRLGRVLETFGYLIGLRFDLMFEQAALFGEWLAHRVTGWSDGEATEEDLLHLDRVAKQATAFGPAVQAVLTELQKNKKTRTLAILTCGASDSKVISVGAYTKKTPHTNGFVTGGTLEARESAWPLAKSPTPTHAAPAHRSHAGANVVER